MKFFNSNDTQWRLFRTIIQGVIGVILANIDVIFTDISFIPETLRPVIVMIVIAILSPIMSFIGGKDDE